MADVVEGGGDVPAVEQEPRSFELPSEEAPADAVSEATEPSAEDAAPPPPPPAADGGSSDDEEEKRRPPIPTSSTDEAVPPAASDSLPATAEGNWSQLLSKIHPVVRKHAETVANHPYVQATASSLRQRAGQAQERMQPIVNHPYVQKSAQTLKAGGTKTLETGKKVSSDKRVVGFILAIVALVGLGLAFRVLLQKYPEFGGDLRTKFLTKDEL